MGLSSCGGGDALIGSRMERGLNYLVEHYIPVCLASALFILTWIGVDNARVVSLLGLILCAAGLAQRSVEADLWILVPLAFYGLSAIASTYAAYGNFMENYPSTRMIFFVIYLLMASLDGSGLSLLRRLCALWVGMAAAAGIVQFVWRALSTGGAARLGGFLGNPNAMGIFLVTGWFALMRCVSEEDLRPAWRFLTRFEPVVLIALTLTLSMGSFAAMAAGVLCLFILKRRQSQEAFHDICRLLAKAALGMGTGMLLYLAAARTGLPWSCLAVLLYAGAVVACWEKFEGFLKARPSAAAGIAALGILVAAAAVVVRPSAADTFTERLAMMRNGLRYLTVNPLLGVGPYQWRFLNLYDGDKYFNTWHIHNALLHVGVELGVIAMAALLLAVLRFYRKNTHPLEKSGFTAFCCHNLMDTSFFYMGIFALAVMTSGNPRNGGRKLGGATLKVFFGMCAALFAYNLYHITWIGGMP